MKYLSLFSGIGGFELGILKAHENISSGKAESEEAQRRKHLSPRRNSGNGPKHDLQAPPVCIGYSEIDRYAIQIYETHFPDHKNYGDITKITASTLPDFDVLVGGFPCQAFSVAGKRAGFADTRGTLFFDIARILKEKQPRLFVLENVKGLLSHDNGRTIKVIFSTLTELGYDFQWQVLNSKDFGVPQNRERIIIVGHLRGTPRPKIFPFGEVNSVTESSRRQTREEVANTLKAKQGGPDLDNSYLIDLKASGSNTRRGMFSKPDNAKTLDHDCAQAITNGAVVRKLTPTECERLQGFPDNWTRYGRTEVPIGEYCLPPEEDCICSVHYREISDTQRYKCLGNAVTTNVIEAVFNRLLTLE